MHFPRDRTAYTTAFDGPVMDHWLEQKIAQTANASAMQDRSAMQEDPNLYSRVLYRLSYVPPLRIIKLRHCIIVQRHNTVVSLWGSTINQPYICLLLQVISHPEIIIYVARI